MRIFATGSCEAANVFTLVDPTSFSEAEFETHAIAALQCFYWDYHCIRFGGGIEFEGVIHEPDLALIHRSFSHWFIIEVELLSHSLHGHVVPPCRYSQRYFSRMCDEHLKQPSIWQARIP